jgi:hypothetical protein
VEPTEIELALERTGVGSTAERGIDDERVVTDEAVLGTKDGDLDMVRDFDVTTGNFPSWDEDGPEA